MRIDAVIIMLLSTLSIAAADTVILSEMDNETRVYIQRGNIGPNVECYQYVLDMLRNQNPAFDASHYYVEFDSVQVDGIAVGATEAGEYYTCENGVLTSWDGGDSLEIRRF